jgi:hypothetical protein
LVEICIAMGIMGAVLVPIVGIITHTHRQIAEEKSEAVVSSFASSVLNDALFKKGYEETVSSSGEEVIDGTTVRWNLEVTEVSGLTVQFQRVVYHEPCGGGAEGGASLYPVQNEAVENVDKKYGGSVLKTLRLTVEWRSPGQSFDDEAAHKRLVLLTRKGRLE